MAPRRRPTYQGRRDRQKLRKVESRDGENAIDRGSIKAKAPKRKYALIFGYKGTAYNGLQKQTEDKSNVRTIEGVLMDALRAINSITEAQIADPFKLHWARVGRTDRGVHAACQVICAKLSMGPLTDEDKAYVEQAKEEIKAGNMQRSARDEAKKPVSTPADVSKEGDCWIKQEETTYDLKEEDKAEKPDEHKRIGVAELADDDAKDDAAEEEHHPLGLQRKRELRFLSNLREQLPDDIEIYDVVRVWGTWDARMRAGRRVYEYCLPVRALQKVRLRDNHDEFMRFCQLLSVDEPESKFCPFEQKQKLFNAIRSRESSVVDQLKTDFSEGGLAAICDLWRTEMSTIRKSYFTIDANKRKELWTAFQCEWSSDLERPPYPPPVISALYSVPYVTKEDPEPFTDENFQEFQEILSMLTGSHHWYNFTSRITSRDPTGYRFIEEIKAFRMSKPVEGQELIAVRVIGQSFLLNQIRKMIAIALEIYMGLAPWAAIQDLLTPPLEPKRHLHLAPGEGLLLERVFFDHHDRQQRASLERLVLHTPFELIHPHGDIMEDFLTSGTYPNIIDDLVTSRGVFRKENKINLLLDDEVGESPSTLSLNLADESDLPVWAKILRYKHTRLHPWIAKLFETTNTWRRYLSDVLWHPFVLENYPTPLMRSETPTEAEVGKSDSQVNDSQ